MPPGATIEPFEANVPARVPMVRVFACTSTFTGPPSCRCGRFPGTVSWEKMSTSGAATRISYPGPAVTGSMMSTKPLDVIEMFPAAAGTGEGDVAVGADHAAVSDGRPADRHAAAGGRDQVVRSHRSRCNDRDVA